MSKRKLTRIQTRRLSEQHAKRINRASRNNPLPDSASLGPERKGLVVAHFGTQVNVEDSETSQIERCHLRANLPPIVAGDYIIWRSGSTNGVVESMLPRTTSLMRPDNFGKLKPVAANIDQMLITLAPKPEPFANLIDRYLIAAEVNGIDPIILVNKVDILEGTIREKVLKISAIYSKLGYNVIDISAHTREGLADLEETLVAKTSIFVGQSGVGKSSLVKALCPDLEIKIGSLSNAKEKGRHTTTHSELFRFPKGGACIDSPGIREFGLWHVSEEDVTKGFIEINKAAKKCKFRNCRHKNDPGCAVRAAIKTKEISEQRYKSYLQIIASLSNVAMKNHS